MTALKQMFAICFAFVCAAVTASSAFAQDRNVTGTILDETDTGIAGAYVVVKGETRGAMTDDQGRFNITVSPSDVLVASFLGYLDEEVKVGDQTKITIKLVPAANELEGVVKVAYGTQRKASVIGSISTVEMGMLTQSQGNLSTSLAGKLAGVVAIQKTGEPGASADFWIRGVSTFGANSTPLILVDGVERSMDMVDTEDIASLSILKDASATALYGVRGANGIVLITTRRGSESKPQLSVKVETGMTSPVKLPEMASTGEFIDFLNNMYVNSGQEAIFTDFQKEQYLSGADPDLYPSVDWVNEVFKNQAMTTKANIGVSGGTKNVRYYVGGSYYLEDGILNTAANDRYDAQMSYQRFNFRTNVDINLTKSTVLGMNVSTQFTVKNSPAAGLDALLQQTMTLTPTAIPLKYSDGTLAAIKGTANPYNLLNERGYSNTSSNVAQSTVSLTQDFSDFVTEGLTARAAFSFDATNTNTLNRSILPKTYRAIGRGEPTEENPLGPLQYEVIDDYAGYITLSTSNSGKRYINFEGSINYERQFAYAHRVSAMALYSMRSLSYTHPESYIAAFPYKSMGVAARTTYSYKDRYFFEFNMGYNGSENFAPGHRFGFFPAVAVGYMISNEPWWESISDTINLLKFKASYGSVGNDQIGGSRRFAYNTTINTSATGAAWGTVANSSATGYQTVGGITTAEMGNAAVEWEQATKGNVGVELGLFNDLTIQADLFRDYRDGIFLMRQSTPTAIGLQKDQYVNIGEMLNRGFDMSVVYDHTFANGLNVSARGNFTFNRNRLIYNDQPTPVEEYLSEVGFAYGQRKGLISCGLFKDQADIDSWPEQTFGDVQPGDIKYKDINGDGYVDQYDKVAIGYTTIPEINYGFGLSIGYKGFDASVFFNGVSNVTRQIGGTNLYGASSSPQLTGQVFKDVAKNHWTVDNPNQNAPYPRLGTTRSNNNTQTSDYWTRDMSFLRLKNAEIGYTFPKKLTKKAGIQALRLYVSGTNLITFSEFKLWDPELDTAYGTRYPITRNVSLGLNLNF
ncbi:MAG: TonB-dependent receptor [Bacteroidales bacterium]|nr:TonB-dependent receptor [Bacteroidales bacterium]